MAYERIAPGIFACTGPVHRFGTDAVLLAHFSEYQRREHVCDLGTGCGIIPLLMQQNRPPKEIFAVDIQPDAIAQLIDGMKESPSIVSEIHPICADLKTLWEGAPLNSLDLVTCNPPYQPKGSGAENLSPGETIARHEVCCTIEDVCVAAKKLLRFGGRLCVCNRPARLTDTMVAMRKHKIEPKRLQFVAKSPDAPPWLFLLEGRSGGKPAIQVLPGIFLSAGTTTILPA